MKGAAQSAALNCTVASSAPSSTLPAALNAPNRLLPAYLRRTAGTIATSIRPGRLSSVRPLPPSLWMHDKPSRTFSESSRLRKLPSAVFCCALVVLPAVPANGGTRHSGKSWMRRNDSKFNPNSEVARFDWKKPLTRLATLATLSPRERARCRAFTSPSADGAG